MTVAYKRPLTSFPNAICDIGSLAAELSKDPALASGPAFAGAGMVTGGDYPTGAFVECLFAAALSPGEESALDAVIAAHAGDHEAFLTREAIKASLYTTVTPPLVVDVSTAGLTIAVTVEHLIDADETTVSADPLLTKHVLASLVHDQGDDSFFVLVRTYTVGQYADLSAGETLVEDLGEWTIAPNGDTLDPV